LYIDNKFVKMNTPTKAVFLSQSNKEEIWKTMYTKYVYEGGKRSYKDVVLFITPLMYPFVLNSYLANSVTDDPSIFTDYELIRKVLNKEFVEKYIVRLISQSDIHEIYSNDTGMRDTDVYVHDGMKRDNNRFPLNKIQPARHYAPVDLQTRSVENFVTQTKKKDTDELLDYVNRPYGF
jgi:hypothetical protein